MPDSTLNNNALLPPSHVGIIMDGNGRWAQNKGLPRTAGHKEGLEAAKRIIATAAKLGIKYVTLYTFSTENWKRTQEEVGFLMNLIKLHLRAEFAFYKKNGIKIRFLGDFNGLPEDVKNEIVSAEKETSQFSGLTVVLAINYGGQNEIKRAIQKLISKNIPAENITEEAIAAEFDIPELPPADLIIRTGGEKRLSNFLLWHSAYAELLFSNTLWPDYNEEEFLTDIQEFNKRTRRFGAV